MRALNTVPGNKLSEHEERRLLRVLNSPKYRDLSPRQVIPALAEQGTYIASEATAYRVLHKHGMQKHRESTRPATSKKPDELVATEPNQVFCWDITYLKRSVIGTFFYLYLVTDIFSRRIVAARVYEAENDEHAADLFVDVQQREKLAPGETHLHSDNGSAMKGATLKATLERLGRGGNMGNTTGRLLQLLDAVGAAELEEALVEVLEHDRIHIGAVRQVVDRRRSERGLPPPISVPITRSAHAQLTVTPHSLSTYDSLKKERHDA